jgi:hypothetical protein
VTIEIPSTGERFEARIVTDEPSAPLAVTLGPGGRTRYTLAAMLNVGWRILDVTAAERELLAAHGITLHE